VNEWTEREISYLELFYPTGERKVILDALPGRTWASVTQMASVMKLKRRKLAGMPADEVFSFVLSYKEKYQGNSPSYREIVKNTSITSTSGAKRVLKELEKQGRLTTAGTRSIMLDRGAWKYG